jgi:hypothetical protein
LSDSPEVLNGACNCGAVRYIIRGRPLAVVACHCTNCRKQSGAAHSVNVVVKASAMSVDGSLEAYQDPDSESGVPVAREFCGDCGSPIRSVPGASPKIIAVKAGTMERAGEFAPTMHIWTSSALPWVEIPDDLPTFAKSPPV